LLRWILTSTIPSSSFWPFSPPLSWPSPTSFASSLRLCWCTESVSLLTVAACANGGCGFGLGHAGWRKVIFRFANATVGCKWETAALWLFISMTVSFHLSEIPRRRARETWHDLFGFHFFPGYYASKCAPRFLCGRAHPGMLHLTDVSL
jgi:hypothetical protein